MYSNKKCEIASESGILMRYLEMKIGVTCSKHVSILCCESEVNALTMVS